MYTGNHLSRKGLTVWRIYGLIQSLFLVLVAGGISALNFFFFELGWVYIVTVVTLFLFIALLTGVLPSLRWKRWRYEVREHEIELQHGLIVRKRTLIPMVRVQHVDTEQGPILRSYQLASIHISTAATSHTIPFLDEQEAESMRRRISELARVAEDDV
ncbi:PH domain-containing protein [Chryseomicrobium sp. FSL W7-1435]|uniref:PH domain-containing protein n=1 Tax=Chryseomicrobium sp. FSL W7-1435 TaxID=2921704 RepID=UPI003159E4AD